MFVIRKKKQIKLSCVQSIFRKCLEKKTNNQLNAMLKLMKKNKKYAKK